MNVLEEMKRMVDEFVIESEEFIRRMKENDRKMEQEHREVMRMIDQSGKNWEQVNNNINIIRHG
ncbi:hypothetical protein [Bacteroides sp. An322]|uniref:hypothetical protein n=1 Tax=Bacteroides sp. An322 TaxID=1965632 RepID=UPI000B3A2A71|nr:hypothetical protein [Bacteroides sp. An322]OUO23771.1 hypothetical protein B5F91_02705 [Bacteroides sp. An322]